MDYINILVDDDPISSFLLGEILDSLEMGKPKEIFLNGADLFHWLENRDLNKCKIVIYLDIMMPQMDGWQVLERLKEDRYSKQLTVIMVSSSVSPIDRSRALESELVLDYLTKPLRIADLERIRSILRPFGE